MRQEEDMNINLQLQPIVALIAGVLVLVAPRLLTWIIGIYLIVIGVMGLLGK
jgi:threonine/homoserine efflux transporter RhtA